MVRERPRVQISLAAPLFSSENAEHSGFCVGGAITFDHPLDMSGTRLDLTSALKLGQRGTHRAIATTCIGVGQGISLLLTRP
ncbi:MULTISPECIES: hypothetical protein [unclassified Rhizobium]|uniref:hypothetical protein n=1 Tax=unclassified Rhizobium TaxID=2613769 RepID=UPI0012E339D7|nr:MULTISPECIES: hypothetical protein [unclassified Rhizobium]